MWFIISLFSNSNNKKTKLDDYVKEQATYQIPSTNIISTLPSIQLDSADAKEVNELIKNAYNTAIKSKNTQYTYQASLNKKYLSIALITNRVDSITKYSYSQITTYTFDIKTGKKITDSELLKEYNTSWEKIATSFEQEMKNFYQEELESMYFLEKDCNYNCFLENRHIHSYQEGLSLFVVNNQLMYYRPFMIFSKWGEEDFYRHEDFLFEIKESNE